jgi:hypothetical protein
MKRIYSKLFRVLTLIGLLFSANGCLSYRAVQIAKGQPVHTGFWALDRVPDDKPHPEYHFLLPVTLPADIVTSPFQLVWYGIGNPEGL